MSWIIEITGPDIPKSYFAGHQHPRHVTDPSKAKVYTNRKEAEMKARPTPGVISVYEKKVIEVQS